MNLYVLGGRQRKRWIRSLEAERRFDRAIILRLNTSTQTSEKIIEYHTPWPKHIHSPRMYSQVEPYAGIGSMLALTPKSLFTTYPVSDR